MKRLLQVLVPSLLLITLAACGTQHGGLSDAPVGVAEAQPGWEGVNNLFRDSLFYFGGQPDVASFERLAQQGVTTVVNIRRPEELEQLGFDEQEVVEAQGMRYVNIPVTPEAFSRSDVDRLAEVLAETEGAVLVHCGSSNRVGGMWAGYLALHRGMTLDEALARGEAAGLRRASMVDAVKRVVEERP